MTEEIELKVQGAEVSASTHVAILMGKTYCNHASLKYRDQRIRVVFPDLGTTLLKPEGYLEFAKVKWRVNVH